MFMGKPAVTYHDSKKHKKLTMKTYMYAQPMMPIRFSSNRFQVECPLCPELHSDWHIHPSSPESHLTYVHMVIAHPEYLLRAVGYSKQYIIKDLIFHASIGTSNQYFHQATHADTNWPDEVFTSYSYFMNLRVIFNLDKINHPYIEDFRALVNAYYPTNRAGHGRPYIETFINHEDINALIGAELP